MNRVLIAVNAIPAALQVFGSLLVHKAKHDGFVQIDADLSMRQLLTTNCIPFWFC